MSYNPGSALSEPEFIGKIPHILSLNFCIYGVKVPASLMSLGKSHSDFFFPLSLPPLFFFLSSLHSSLLLLPHCYLASLLRAAVQTPLITLVLGRGAQSAGVQARSGPILGAVLGHGLPHFFLPPLSASSSSSSSGAAAHSTHPAVKAEGKCQPQPQSSSFSTLGPRNYL